LFPPRPTNGTGQIVSTYDYCDSARGGATALVAGGDPRCGMTSPKNPFAEPVDVPEWIEDRKYELPEAGENAWADDDEIDLFSENEDDRRKPSQATELLDLAIAMGLEGWRTPSDDPYVTISDPSEATPAAHYALSDRRVAAWLKRMCGTATAVAAHCAHR